MTPAQFRAALKACGLTQRAFAERLGLAYSTVNRWATGEIKPIPRYAIAYLELLAEYRAAVAA